MLEDLVEGVENSHLYFRRKKSIKKRIRKELEKANDYYAVQEIGKKYVNGIKTGAKITFWTIATPFGAYFLAGTPLPYIGKIANLPQADKAGHAAVGMAIGWFTGKVYSKLDDYFHFWQDEDDKIARRNKHLLSRFGLEFLANITAGVGKEIFDKYHGGVSSVWDAMATIGGGQLINGILEYTRAGKYEVVVNEMRKRLYELGMDDDGHPLAYKKAYEPVKLTLSDAHRISKAVRKGDLIL